MNEGITVTPNLNAMIDNIAKTYLKNKNFVCMTHRINSYSVYPNICFKTSQISNLIGFTVVSGKRIVIDNSDLESVFFNKPFKLFTKLEYDLDWQMNYVITK